MDQRGSYWPINLSYQDLVLSKKYVYLFPKFSPKHQSMPSIYKIWLFLMTCLQIYIPVCTIHVCKITNCEKNVPSTVTAVHIKDLYMHMWAIHWVLEFVSSVKYHLSFRLIKNFLSLPNSVKQVTKALAMPISKTIVYILLLVLLLICWFTCINPVTINIHWLRQISYVRLIVFQADSTGNEACVSYSVHFDFASLFVVTKRAVELSLQRIRSLLRSWFAFGTPSSHFQMIE